MLQQTHSPAKTTSSAKELKWEFPASKTKKNDNIEAKSSGIPQIEVPNKIIKFSNIFYINKTELLTNELGSNCLSLCLFSPKKIRSSTDFSMHENKKIIGECSISLIKLFKEDIYDYDMNHSEQGLLFVEVKRNKQTTEKFWRKGNQIGFLEATFKFLSCRFVRQHIIGVRTEHGLFLLNF